MGADHGAVDHLQGRWNHPALVQGLQYPFPQPGQGPAPELAVDRRPLAELFRQVTPRRTCAGYPENPIQNKTMVHGFAPVRCADGQNEAFVKRPFLVRHQVSCQAGLHRRYQLESRSARPVNPFCQHGLAKAGSGTVYGPSDGLKIYFIAESSNGSVSRLESAGISPPLDTYYPMFSGDTLDLNGTAPVGRANWKSDEIVFDEASTVTVTAIGINIGQAYLAGGGGHHNDEFFLATEAFARIFEVTPIEVALPILRYAIERLNDFADCRGSVFAFKKTWRGTELLAELLRGRGTLEVAFQPGDSQLSGGSSQGCNVPSYSFRLRADAAPLPSVQTSDVITKEDYSEPVDFIPGLRSCADRVGPAKVWAAIMDRAFQFIPDPDLKQLRYQWYVEGRQIPMTGSGTLSFSKEVTREPNYVRSQTSVTVGYSVSVSGRLLLTTNGADGNYWLRVECWVVDAAGAVFRPDRRPEASWMR
jgi:hypothetical protein